MDAVEYVKQRDRMCDYYVNCDDCPAGNYEGCASLNEIPNMVPVVEKWANEHPVKTRQSEFLKMFPNARIESDGMPSICPIVVDKRCYNKDDDALCCFVRDEEKCRKCRCDFWLKEIE